MVYPLTNYDYVSIFGRLSEASSTNLSDPYVFKIISENRETAFHILASDALAITALSSEFERDDAYEWDIPTINEWLVLSGCESNPYPWGAEPPTPQRANLDFGIESKIRPVGTYPLGISDKGAHDCCGNVHEIVRLSRSKIFPNDFRLAGGCYLTNLRNAACHTFRDFREDKILKRKNVGLRLVRYAKEDYEKRFNVSSDSFSYIKIRHEPGRRA